jgi:hypothetical protein
MPHAFERRVAWLLPAMGGTTWVCPIPPWDRKAASSFVWATWPAHIVHHLVEALLGFPGRHASALRRDAGSRPDQIVGRHGQVQFPGPDFQRGATELSEGERALQASRIRFNIPSLAPQVYDLIGVGRQAGEQVQQERRGPVVRLRLAGDQTPPRTGAGRQIGMASAILSGGLPHSNDPPAEPGGSPSLEQAGRGHRTAGRPPDDGRAPASNGAAPGVRAAPPRRLLSDHRLQAGGFGLRLKAA